MKKIFKLQTKIRDLHLNVAEKRSTELVQYWRGGDWQIQGLEKAYATVLKEIEKLIENN